MNRRQNIKRYLFLALASFLTVLGVMLLTSPMQNITYALVFFVALFMLLIFVGHLISYISGGTVTAKRRSWIVIISAFIVLTVMFKSAQSLNWVDALILILAVTGLLFYTSRRS